MTISERIRIVRVRNSAAPSELQERTAHRDQSDVVERCNRWREVFRDADVSYPATLLAVPVAANWVHDADCEVDARSPQGISFAMSASVAPRRMIFHCAGATGRTIHDATGLGVGQFIVDSERAPAMLGACADRPQHLLVDVYGVLLSRVGTVIRGGHQLPVESLATAIDGAIEDGCARYRLPRPALTVFPDWIALTHDM